METFFLAPHYVYARLFFDVGLAILYFVAFLSAYNQFPALLGNQGLLPVNEFLPNRSFKTAPSIFHFKYSDHLLKMSCLLGMVLAVFIMLGTFINIPIFAHLLSWLLMYFIYLSIVNVGQEFYGFGWETMILEAGFFGAFMGPHWVTPSWIPILIMRWMLFRTEMGAGLIKLRGDACWRDFTCLYYHHETQPLPNPLSRFFHHGPTWIHRFGVVFSHFCQLVAPLGLFFPQPIAGIAGGFLIFHQLILVVSGNYSWLNWITIVMGLLCFQDFGITPVTINPPFWFECLQYSTGILCLVLSYKPLLNLFSSNQYMNYCWNRWHLVGAYGAFGCVTKKRYEIVLEGTTDEYPNDKTIWREYGFKGKPTELDRTPPVVAPYHLRLDWMIWFLPFTVHVGENQIYVRAHSLWFIRLMSKLLKNDKQLLKLFRHNPFPDENPKWVRAQFYHYEFTMKGEKNIWKRKSLGMFCPRVSQKMLNEMDI